MKRIWAWLGAVLVGGFFVELLWDKWICKDYRSFVQMRERPSQAWWRDSDTYWGDQ